MKIQLQKGKPEKIQISGKSKLILKCENNAQIKVQLSKMSDYEVGHTCQYSVVLIVEEYDFVTFISSIDTEIIYCLN